MAVSVCHIARAGYRASLRRSGVSNGAAVAGLRHTALAGLQRTVLMGLLLGLRLGSNRLWNRLFGSPIGGGQRRELRRATLHLLLKLPPLLAA